MTVRSFFLFAGGLLSLLFVSIGSAQEVSSLSAAPAAPAAPAAAAAPETDLSATGGGNMELLSKLPVHLTLGLDGGYDDRVLSSSGGQGSYFTRATVLLGYNLHGLITGPFAGTSARAYRASSGNHASAALHNSLSSADQPQLDIQAGSDFTYYPGVSRGRTSDLNSHLDSSGSFNLSRLITVGASGYVAYRTEPDFSANVGVENQRTNYLRTTDNLSASYHWSPRIDFVTSDDIQRVQYDNQSFNALNRFENTIAEEYRFSFRPDLTLLGDYRYQIVDYDDSLRDSTTQYGLVGFEKSIGPEFKMDLRGGATFRSFAQDGSRVDPHVESSVTYEGAHHAVINWNTSYGIEESNQTQALTRVTFRTGLNFSYGFSSRITGTLDGYYHHDENESIIPPSTTSTGGNGISSAFSADAYDVSVSVRYAIKAYFTVNLGFEHTQVSSASSGSAQANRDYSRNRYSAGLTFIY
jgi:hypothetical protein